MNELGVGKDLVQAKNAVLEMGEKMCRQRMRLMAPEVDAMPQLYPGIAQSMNQYLSIRHCNICSPPPKVYTCPLCDWETTEKWKMTSHNNMQPKWCTDRAKKKERVWASKVGLDK